MLNSILEGTSMSKWEMNNLVGGDNNNGASGCTCTGGLKSDNNNSFSDCSCDSPYVSPVKPDKTWEIGYATASASNFLAI